MVAEFSRPPDNRRKMLVLDTDESVGASVPYLRERFDVTTAQSISTAVELLRRTPLTCQVVVSDVRADPEETFSMFRLAKSLVRPPTILVTTADVERVPDALLSGADTVLLKPFAPNLLVSRLARLTQEREYRGGSTAVHCPHCNAARGTTIDFLSHRRAWYACLACKRVWIAKRPER